MEQMAVVKRIHSSGVAEVSLMRQLECGLNCKSCEGCAQKPKDELLALADNAVNAEVGDIVTVRPNAGGAAVLVYLLPCVGLFVGYALAERFRLPQGLWVPAAFLGLAAGFVPAVLANRAAVKRNKPEFTIVSLVR